FAEIRLIQLEFERPPGRTILCPDFPPATFPILTQSPIRVISRWLPFSVLPSEGDTAINHAAEIPLEVVMVRRRRGIALGVQADDEIIAPVIGRVLDFRSEVHAFLPPSEPETHDASRTLDQTGWCSPFSFGRTTIEDRSGSRAGHPERIGEEAQNQRRGYHPISVFVQAE